MSLAKKWLQRRIAFATSMRRHSGPMFDIINAVGDLPIEDDDPARCWERAPNRPAVAAASQRQ